MGLWVARPKLLLGEEVRWRRNVNRKQGATRAVGGRLFVTGSRIVFQPSRFDSLFGGQAWQADLDNIKAVDIEGVDKLKASQRDYGALRRRLRIVTRHSTELFVINSVPEAVEAIHKLVPSSTSPVARHSPAKGDPRSSGDILDRAEAAEINRHVRSGLLRTYVAVGVMLCLVAAVCLEVAGHGTVRDVGAYLAAAALLLGLSSQIGWAFARRRTTS